MARVIAGVRGPVTVVQKIVIHPDTVQDLNLIPDTLALVITGFAPSVVIGLVLTPDPLSLVITGFAPVVSTPQVIVPGVLALTITGHAPTLAISNNITITPGVLATVVTGFAPTLTITNNVLIVPATLALVVQGYSPTVIVPASATAGSGAYYYPDYQPLYRKAIEKPQLIKSPVLVVPGTLQLHITGHIPTVWITRTITTFAPYVEVTRYITTDDVMTLFQQGVLNTQEAISLWHTARKGASSGSQYRLLEQVLQETG